MQFRDELEPDEFDNYYTQEQINGPAPAADPTHTPPPIPEPAPAPETIAPLKPQSTRNATAQAIDEAASDLTTATAYFIKNMQGSTTPDKTLRQIHNLSRTLKELKQIVRKPRPVGRPRGVKNRKTVA